MIILARITFHTIDGYYNTSAPIKITAERIALLRLRVSISVGIHVHLNLRVNTSLLRILQFTELKYTTNQ